MTRHKTSGNSILLFLPFIIIVVALVQFALLQSNSFTATINHFRAVGVRDALVNNIRLESSIPATFRSSLQTSNAGNNPDLQNCVFGTGLTPCPANVEMPLTLYSPVSSAVIISGPAALNGAQTQAALYDTKGNLCANSVGPATDSCPFEVTTSFVATCTGGVSSCSVAQSLMVHYTIKRKNDSAPGIYQPLQGTISQVASSVDVAWILPGTLASTQGNMKVSLLQTVTSGTSDVLLTIMTAVRAGAPGATDAQVAEMAQAFLNNGYTDPNFIQAVSTATFRADKYSDTIPMINGLGQAGVTDVNEAVFLSKVDIYEVDWIKMLVASGTTNEYYAFQLFFTFSITSASQFNAAVNAVSGLPQDALSVAIAGTGVTDPTVAGKIYAQASSYTSDVSLAAGLVYGGWYSDPTKSQAIVSALAGIPSPSARYLAQFGITDPSLANQLQQIVSVIPDPDWAADAIRSGGGSIAATQAYVDTAMAALNSSSQTSITTAANSAGTSSTTTSTSLSTISLISTCTTCSSVTF
jgi:hypothetical protein